LRTSRRRFLQYGAMGIAAAMLPAAGAQGGQAARRPDATIVACAIHPAVGVARVGNSPDQFFLGPEVPGLSSVPTGGFKDPCGRIKRQAARFRVYGLDAEGNVVRELTSDDAEISWTVHLANKKGAWYAFDIPFDIPEATGDPPAPGVKPDPPLQTPRRNASVFGSDRTKLIIDPGPRSIQGASSNATGADRSFAFDTGIFIDQSVYLGEVRTDERGRLLVLGGFGKSGPGTNIELSRSPINNDLWQEDTSDGTVDAVVTIDGRVMQATGAWVIVGPPNFSPGLHSAVTMYDVIFEAATKLDPARAPVRPSFTRQIYPLFARLAEHQWVNAGMARQFGWRSAGDLLDPATFALLSDNSNQNRFVRETLFRRFRNPAYKSMESTALPPYYGDHTTFPAETPRTWMAMLPLQYQWLKQWAAGDFDADWPAGGILMPDALEALPIDEQPHALDRAALDECNGGAFHPGTELTWPMRIVSMYEEPFRLRRRTGPEPDWGEMLSSVIALGDAGPLTASSPGDLTRWMAVPWQADTGNCLSAYEPQIDEYLPTFWPAGVPNDILAMESYQILMDANSDDASRESAFNTRLKWLRGFPLERGADARFARTNGVLTQWSALGIVSRMPGPAGDADYPADIWVEAGRDPALDS
jgi:L-Lysine epsilon oxidase N-terminal/L-lysine epsilon oxidase C-terminal domain